MDRQKSDDNWLCRRINEKRDRESELFMCCATTRYCKREHCLLEFNYAVNTNKRVIYILFEHFTGNDDRMKRLDTISFRFAGQKYYKNDNVDGIVKAIEELRRVI